MTHHEAQSQMHFAYIDMIFAYKNFKSKISKIRQKHRNAAKLHTGTYRNSQTKGDKARRERERKIEERERERERERRREQEGKRRREREEGREKDTHTEREREREVRETDSMLIANARWV